ncbi:DJ-1/PfpI family protein [Bordetella pseudohinzii]|uniref:Intracellular protease, PfpI family n=2 Tax=Bordetella pseudohinzii TaxID=1331258 RepID=A0A0J6C9J8_9BORD|nr:DJ-1/PfpI family protein [Bordetella pseudohinzii]ANY16529.1 hypothetical protein BBN53_11860 [Bordetella pseudohinzii]KMM27678.1 hypothetical protein L540_01375 [Bordetella pseudohinzii]KXA81506.1 hypothetical protein AW877_03950 [Bordetella pseudohinzii]KXA82134.1 hypothetical protein AW878_02475 [Bordetella pseudohinzii]CUI33834.1 intracellular protease%2C PfpI family [Bordetella pseudohinzii]
MLYYSFTYNEEEMMNQSSKKVEVLLLPGFQELEFWYPVLRLREAGVGVSVVGRDDTQTVFSRLGYPVVAEQAGDGGAGDLLIVPGVVGEPDADTRERALSSIRAAHARGALIAASGSSVALLAEAGMDTAKTITAASVDDMPAFMQTVLARTC